MVLRPSRHAAAVTGCEPYMMASAPFSLTHIQQPPKSLPPPTQDRSQRTERIWELIRLWRNSLGTIDSIALRWEDFLVEGKWRLETFVVGTNLQAHYFKGYWKGKWILDDADWSVEGEDHYLIRGRGWLQGLLFFFLFSLVELFSSLRP